MQRALPGGGQRWRIAATLAGGIFERAVIDVAFAAAPVQAPDQIKTSGLLEFASVDAVKVPTLSIEQHLAEKLHAYTRVYTDGRRSTRVKDLVDVVAIANTQEVDAANLAEAITVIFERRGENAVPATLPQPPGEWAAPWRRLVREVPAADELVDEDRIAAALFDPILARAVTMGTWRPAGRWAT